MTSDQNNNKTANKGEWSEFYVFLKILSERELPAADKNLNIIDGKFFLFHKIIREEKNQKPKIYDISKSDTEIYITDDKGVLLKKFDTLQLKDKTLKIFKKIKKTTGRSFSIKEANSLMSELLCTEVKADNNKKADLVAIIYDRISETSPMLGFSIKSTVGAASTLLNAGKTTNFIFSIDSLSENFIDEINNISGRSKIRDRVKAIIKNGGTFKFHGVSCNEFEINLRKIDTLFPEFLAKMVFDYYSTTATKVRELVHKLSEDQEFKMRYKLSKEDYEYKMKNFLVAIALGMVPGTVWDGFTRAQGGYIVVKENGDVVCYHLYNRDEYLTYLYENTKLETPSSSKHDYGKIYKKDGKLYFNLNLQIRFIK